MEFPPKKLDISDLYTVVRGAEQKKAKNVRVSRGFSAVKNQHKAATQ